MTSEVSGNGAVGDRPDVVHFAPSDGVLLVLEEGVLHAFRADRAPLTMPIAGIHATRVRATQLTLRNAYTDDLVVDLDAERTADAEGFCADLLRLASRFA